MYEKSVKFIRGVFDELESNDYFALRNLGDQTYNMMFEEKSCNRLLKKKLLSEL